MRLGVYAVRSLALSHSRRHPAVICGCSGSCLSQSVTCFLALPLPPTLNSPLFHCSRKFQIKRQKNNITQERIILSRVAKMKTPREPSLALNGVYALLLPQFKGLSGARKTRANCLVTVSQLRVSTLELSSLFPLAPPFPSCLPYPFVCCFSSM